MFEYFPVLGIHYCGSFSPGGGWPLHCSASLVAHFWLVLYLWLELLCALRSRSPSSRSVQKTLSLSPEGARGEVRRERDLGLQLREHLWPVPSTQGGGQPWVPTRWRAGPPWSTPGRVPSGSWDPSPQRCLQVLRLLHSLSLLVVRFQRPTVPVCHTERSGV